MSRQAKSREHRVIRFVTGTDTGVGKTVVSAALCRELTAAGKRVAYYKPVQTGCGAGDGGDAGFVAAAAPGTTVREGLRLAEPLAPAVAAERGPGDVPAPGDPDGHPHRGPPRPGHGRLPERPPSVIRA